MGHHGAVSLKERLEDISKAISRKDHPAFANGLDRPCIVHRKPRRTLVVRAPLEGPVAVGVLFGKGKTLLLGPLLKVVLDQFGELAPGMTVNN